MSINYELLKLKKQADLSWLFGRTIPCVLFVFLVFPLFLLTTPESWKITPYIVVCAFIFSFLITIIFCLMASMWTNKPYSDKDKKEGVLYILSKSEIAISIIIEACTLAILYLIVLFACPLIMLAYIPFAIWIGYLYHRTWIKNCEEFASQ